MRILSCVLTVCMLSVAVSLASVSVAQASSENERIIHDYLAESLHLNDAAISGILANMECESGLKSDIYNSNHSSYGLCQWSGSRLTNLKNFCNRNGYDWRSMTGQLHFLQYELTNSYAKVLSYLRGVPNSASGAYNAGYYFCAPFEIPANTSGRSAQRGGIAQNKYWNHWSSCNHGTQPKTYSYAY